MTPLDALKAGIKTALQTFLAAMLVLVVGLLGVLNDWATKGKLPDLGYVKGAVIAAVLAAAAGVLTAVVRFVQIEGPVVIAKILNAIFGAVPAYSRPARDATGTPSGNV